MGKLSVDQIMEEAALARTKGEIANPYKPAISEIAGWWHAGWMGNHLATSDQLRAYVKYKEAETLALHKELAALRNLSAAVNRVTENATIDKWSQGGPFMVVDVDVWQELLAALPVTQDK